MACTRILLLKSNFDLIDGKSIEWCITVSNFGTYAYEFKPFKTSRKLPYFEKIQLCACLILRAPNLHTAPERHLIKIRTFLKKIDSYLEKYKFARRFEGLRLT